MKTVDLIDFNVTSETFHGRWEIEYGDDCYSGTYIIDYTDGLYLTRMDLDWDQDPPEDDYEHIESELYKQLHKKIIKAYETTQR
jgi:hypothetical protein